MLCPEVWNYPAPKVIISHKQNEDVESIHKTINMNSFYKSLIITCPDELQTPSDVEEILTADSDFYKITDCSLSEFIEPAFIENFVKNGRLYCLSSGRNCIVQDCAAICPDGILTLHINYFVFQTLGIEGIKRPHNYYEVKINLKSLKNFDKVRQGLIKLELMDFYIMWEPHQENICPSSIAKYFDDKNVKVSIESLEMKRVLPTVDEIPSIKDVDVEDMVEWVGLVAHNADMSETDSYISTYIQPESEHSLKTTRISVLIVKGFITPTIIVDVCKSLKAHVLTRDLENYWLSISVQSQENSLWQWSTSTPKMFQAHDSSYNVFFSHDSQVIYSIGQLKYT